MKKSHFGMFLALAVAAIPAFSFAQNLNTTAVTDQFTTGARGNSGTYDVDGSGAGAPVADTYPTAFAGTMYTLYDGADATGNPKYINTYANNASTAGDTANGETPVSDITGIKHPDNNTVLSTLATAPVTVTANTRPGATSASKVVVVSDDGGQNALLFGDSASSSYFAQVDVFFANRSAVPATGYEATYLAIRACRDAATAPVGGAFTFDREASYLLVYDHITRTVRAAKALASTVAASSTVVSTNSATNGTQFDTIYATTAVQTAGWHTFRIEADGAIVNFYLDGTQLATVTDPTPIANGRVALGLRERAVTDEFPAIFDNLSAGPYSAPAPTAADSEWSMY